MQTLLTGASQLRALVLRQTLVNKGCCEVMKATSQADMALIWKGPWGIFIYLPGN